MCVSVCVCLCALAFVRMCACVCAVCYIYWQSGFFEVLMKQGDVSVCGETCHNIFYIGY